MNQLVSLNNTAPGALPARPRQNDNLPSIQRSEAAIKRDFIAALGAVTGPPLIPYDAFARHMKAERLAYFGRIDGTDYYVREDVGIEHLRAAARLVRLEIDPETDQRHRAALGRLYTLTTSQKRSEREVGNLLSAYLHKLRHYPADVVEYALGEISDRVKFFPSWSEISERLDPLVGWRHRCFMQLVSLAHKLNLKRSQ